MNQNQGQDFSAEFSAEFGKGCLVGRTVEAGGFSERKTIRQGVERRT
jgi:hypothetical protein